MAYLDDTGLTYLWSRLKTQLDGKQDASAELDLAIQQAADCTATLEGMDALLAQVVGVPSDG